MDLRLGKTTVVTDDPEIVRCMECKGELGRRVFNREFSAAEAKFLADKREHREST